MASQQDEYPSMLWITIPPVFLLSCYLAHKWYNSYLLKTKGIGKGAPGFQTSVRQVRITPEIRAKLERGEVVSPEEIAAASEKAQHSEEQRELSETQGLREVVEVNENIGMGGYGSLKDKLKTGAANVDSSWLPDNISSQANHKKRKGKKK